MTAASQPGGLGTGPRVTLSDTYRSFRVLNLAERNITTIDLAFAHFENLTELDLGRNRLQKLENLPKGLVSLSCASNELSGRALDGVTGLPLLCSLDLSFNNLEVHSLLPPPKAELPRRCLLNASGHNIGDRPAQPTKNGSDGDDGVQRQFRRPEAPPPLATGEKYMHFQEKFSSLEHLDISWNCLCDLDRLLRTLMRVPCPLQDNLRHLFLAGNPFCLLPAYRERVLGRGFGPGLVMLDDLPVSPVEYRSAAATAAAVEKAQEGCLDGVRENEDEDHNKRPRGKGSFEAVHFHVKLLRLSGLPDLGTTTPERPRCTASAAVAATPPASGAGKAGAVRGETASNSEERREKEEPPPLQKWGDVEFLVPGDNHYSDNHDSPARTGWFSWAAEVVPPLTEAPDADSNDGRSEQPQTEQEAVDSTASDVANNGTPWEVSVALPPSREMRDDVRFQGLRVQLFVGDDEREAEGEEETVEGDASSPAEAAKAVNNVDSVVDGFSSTGEPTHPPGGEGDVEGEAQDQDRVRPQMLPSRRRRLAGRGHLSLSPFLDPAWMMREQHQPQPQQRQQERGEDVTEAESVVTADGEAGGKTGAPAGMRTLFGVNDGAAAPATISGECNVVLEPWVVETMRKGVARRKRERLERKEAARAEAEVNAANDPKGKNSKAAAAAAATARLQEGDEEEEEEEEEIGPSPSARAEVEVTLNPGMASLAVATTGSTAAAPAAADA
ncbi:unnamed protein product [Ectocarpus sp. CCAP 1310/34]|nr:unnamed protein product [Ectocarpus sp. CCAP 1310/34]